MLYKKNLSAIVSLIIWALLFSLACETPTEPPVVMAVLYGQVLERSPIGATLSISNAIVTIDGQIDTTTKFGEFQLSLPCGKSLLLQISHPCYLPFGQHIILHQDT